MPSTRPVGDPRPPHPASSRGWWRLVALAAVLVALVPSGATAEDDPDLRQTVRGDDPVVTDVKVLEGGHVDLGPTYVDGTWRFLVHDDTAKADPSKQSTWRLPDKTVFAVPDAVRLPAPDDPTYAFLGAEPGGTVWALPQTQAAGAPWVGWNTQEPRVMETIDRGMTLRLEGVQGPGRMVTYLQSGSFEEPEVLWTSAKDARQDFFVDVNTHTHANWVFTEPGVYLVRVSAIADLVDGGTATDTQVLRFAVGDGTSPREALSATWRGSTQTPGSTDGAAAPTTGDDDGTLVTVLVAAIAVLAALLLVGAVVAVVRLRGQRRRALGGTDVA